MSNEHNRLLLQIERAMRAINQATITPVLPELTLADFDPVISMVARTRVQYLQALFDMAEASGDGVPDEDQIAELRSLRLSYEEQVAATKALETAIQRGYLDVLPE
jgi:hypothetical protein